LSVNKSQGNLNLNIDDARSLHSKYVPTTVRNFKSESQVLLEDFMEKFKKEAGSQQNLRESQNVKDLIPEPVKGPELGEK
jgi:hypothetical protein